MKKYEIESSDLIPNREIIKMGIDIMDKLEDENTVSPESLIMDDEED